MSSNNFEVKISFKNEERCMKGGIKMESKTISYIIVIILLIVITINLVLAAVNLSDPLAAARHQKILNEFDRGKTWVPVIVRISSEDVKEGFINSFLEKEFINWQIETRTLLSVEVTREGLNKLINNSNIDDVFISESVSLFLDESVPLINATKNGVEDDVLKFLKSSEWVSVIVKLHFRNDTIRDFVLSNLSPSEFKLKGKHLREDGFAGNITKEGLYRLINDPNVRIIYLDRIVQTHLKNDSADKIESKQKETKYKQISLEDISIMLVLIILLIIIYLILHKKIKL